MYFLGHLIHLANPQVRYHCEEKEGAENEVIKIEIIIIFVNKS